MVDFSQVLAQVAGKQISTNSSDVPTIYSNLTKEEQLILKDKYAGTPFGQLSDSELLMDAHQLLAKVAVITGWKVPGGDALTVLLDAFAQKLKRSYASINAQEFLNLVIENGNKTQNWGKDINIYLIDDIIGDYLDRRANISRIEESKKITMQKPKELPPPRDETMQDFYNVIKNGKLYVDFMPLEVYDWLVEKGKIILTPEERESWLEKARKHRQIYLREHLEAKYSIDRQRLYETFSEMMKTGNYSKEEKKAVGNTAKKLVLYNYIQNDK